MSGLPTPLAQALGTRPEKPSLQCPTCGQGFTPRRKDARFCRPLCQQKAARGPRTVALSPTERDRSSRHYARARELAGQLYGLPPDKRLGFMQELIAGARAGNAKLRAILTDRALLCATKEHRSLFPRRAPGVYCTIAQAADRYCARFWGHGVRAVVYGEAPEPPTGEPGEVERTTESMYAGGTCRAVSPGIQAFTFAGDASGFAITVHWSH